MACKTLHTLVLVSSFSASLILLFLPLILAHHLPPYQTHACIYSHLHMGLNHTQSRLQLPNSKMHLLISCFRDSAVLIALLCWCTSNPLNNFQVKHHYSDAHSILSIIITLALNPFPRSVNGGDLHHRVHVPYLLWCLQGLADCQLLLDI